MVKPFLNFIPGLLSLKLGGAGDPCQFQKEKPYERGCPPLGSTPIYRREGRVHGLDLLPYNILQTLQESALIKDLCYLGKAKVKS